MLGDAQSSWIQEAHVVFGVPAAIAGEIRSV
jgi:hypothetical protein